MHHDHITPCACASPESERWLPIRDWPDYEVSDHGRVLSYLMAGSHGINYRRRDRPVIVGNHPTHDDHRGVWLTADRGARKRQINVHILVLEAFVCPRPIGLDGCHWDGDGGNNHLANLRWDTRVANALDNLRLGRCGQATLTESDIPAIWARIIARDPIKMIARDYRVTVASIQNIKAGRSWSHITRDLPGRPKFLHQGRWLHRHDDPPFRLEYRP